MAQSGFLPRPSANCAPAALPNKVEFYGGFDVGEGATPLVINTVAAGLPANATGVRVDNLSCEWLLLSVTYLEGGNCATDGCVDPTDVTPSVVTFLVPPFKWVDVPGGAWSNMDVVVVDPADFTTPMAADKAVEIHAFGACAGICPECAVVVPA